MSQATASQAPAPVTERPCILRVVSGTLKGRAFPLRTTAPVRAGRHVRGPGDIVLPDMDPYASREHAVFRREGCIVNVTDLDSRAGTRVNGVKVSKALLRDGDEIALGRTVIRISLS